MTKKPGGIVWPVVNLKPLGEVTIRGIFTFCRVKSASGNAVNNHEDVTCLDFDLPSDVGLRRCDSRTKLSSFRRCIMVYLSITPS